MKTRIGNLRPAHRGYLYQDLATAYMLVRSLVDGYDRIVVDRKQVADDRIDDLDIVVGSSRIRRQFKSSEKADRKLGLEDFTAAQSSLRIDRLVLTHVRAGNDSAKEYRLCATWQAPDSSDPLVPFLAPIEVTSTVAGLRSRHYRLLAEQLWPANGMPVWAPLVSYAQGAAEIDRHHVLEFCDRFVVELCMPPSSTSLADPGPLERAVLALLEERVGIGRYPNHGRDPHDVAALAIALASSARAQEVELRPADVERALGIRTDYGRVAQAFPLDEQVFYDRPQFRRLVRETALSGQHQLVTGAPGAGKSWELTRLAGELRADGAIVARHYCYLEPGDEVVEKRITTDVFFGNLIAELQDAAPELRGAPTARYAAGLTELEEMLTSAATLGRPIVLIVDGLDHIARVRFAASSLAQDDTDIVERLATINLPAGVALIIGSQPGLHLAPLRDRWSTAIIDRMVPRWERNDIAGLVRRHGLEQSLRDVGITDDADIFDVYALLSERADGNPLYARYLTVGLIAGLSDGSVASPKDWLNDSPPISGGISAYYEHLYRTASEQTQAIADVLGVIDFSITEEELCDMLPGFVGAWLPPALSRLAPVLIDTSGQGGLRIFHESFRRFMTGELSREGRSIAAALEPVITWLKSRGFFANAKSYRFLLPALRRAGNIAEILEIVGPCFVSESVEYGHAADAVERNIALAAEVAAEMVDWVSLVRCVELQRSAYACFSYEENIGLEYWSTYLHLFGPDAVSERLLFDGRPTLSRDDGLLACSLVDDAGGIPPWREYLELPASEEGESGSIYDTNGALCGSDLVKIASEHGWLRAGSRSVLRRLRKYLGAVGDEFKPLFIRTLAARIARMAGPTCIEKLSGITQDIQRRPNDLARSAVAMLALGAADEYTRLGNSEQASKIATLAAQATSTPQLAVACLSVGATVESTLHIVLDPSSLPIAVGPDDHIHDSADVRTWVASIQLLAAQNHSWDTVRYVEQQRIAGEGWYRCWLRFVLEIASVSASIQRGNTVSIKAAFEELRRDVRPFAGNPRPCDLYPIHQVIAETISWALTLARSEEEWRQALDSLSAVSNGTGSHLDREDGGPLPTTTLLELLISHAGSSVGGHLVRELIEQEVTAMNNRGTYYSTHAAYAMRLAHARVIGGECSGAREAWRDASIFLTAYGSHKDPTLFDLVESLPTLATQSKEVAFAALADSQPLTGAVLRHTDGRSTNHTPNAWFGSLLKICPSEAVGLLARTLQEDDGNSGWVGETAIRDIARHLGATADPALLDSVLSTIRFTTDRDGQSSEAVGLQTAPIVRLASTDRELAAVAMRQLASDFGSQGKAEDATARLQMAADAIGVAVPRPCANTSIESAERKDNAPSIMPRTQDTEDFRYPAFPANASYVDLLTGLRIAGQRIRSNDVTAWDTVVLPLAYHLAELAANGRRDEARRLLRFFARHVYVWGGDRCHPLGRIADALGDAGDSSLSAMAYALAYTASHDGWGGFGGQRHRHLVAKGVAADRDLALKIIAEEIAYKLRGSSYITNATRELVECISPLDAPPSAEPVWRTAFAVVAHRLPLPPVHTWFTRLDRGNLLGWTIDESLVAVLLARVSHPRLQEKIIALASVVRAIQRRPQIVIKPLRWWFTTNPTLTSMLLVLDALRKVESEPFPISREIGSTLETCGSLSYWGVQQLCLLISQRGQVPDGQAQAKPSRFEGVPADWVSTPEGRDAILSLDSGHVMERLCSLWPGLPDGVVRRCEWLIRKKSDQDSQRCKERWELAYGRSGTPYSPPVPVLLWEKELFIQALHAEMTNGLSSHLWATGQWSPEVEVEILDALLPSLFVHLGVAASRSVRPSWPEPAKLTDGIGALSVLGKDDSVFEGWTRLAIVERQYVPSSAGSYNSPIECISLFAAVFADQLDNAGHAARFPFARGDVNDWWRCERPLPIYSARIPLGPLIGLARVTDWLGDVTVPIPPCELRNYIYLESPTFAAPLVWADSASAPAIVLRTWSVRNREVLDRRPFKFVGVDLIARPDIVRQLEVLCGTRLRESRLLVH